MADWTSDSRPTTPVDRLWRLARGANTDPGRWQHLMHQQPLLLGAVAFLLGVILDSQLPRLSIFLWVGLALACVSTIVVSTNRRSRFTRTLGHDHRIAILIVGMTLVTTIGAINHRWQTRHYQSAPLAALVGSSSEPTILEGVITSTPQLRRHPLSQQRHSRGQSVWQTRFDLKVHRIRHGMTMQPTSGLIRVTIDDQLNHLLPGDFIRVHGLVHGSRKPTNPGEHDWAAADRRDGIHARLHVDQPEQVVVLRPGGTEYAISRFIARLGRKSQDVLLEHLDEQAGPLAVAMVIGRRDFVDQPTRDRLLVTGTAHLLSVSGMHLGIVAWIASTLALLTRTSPTTRILVVLAACLFYTALTGGRPPVVRAVILVAVFLIAIGFRRPSQPLNTLGLAAILLIFYCPSSLFGVGVQLSFLAVGTLLIASGRVGRRAQPLAVEQAIQTEQRLHELIESTRPRWMRASRYLLGKLGTLVWFSSCVTVISAPLVWHQFRVVAPISVLTNVLLAPTLSLALGLGIVTVIAGMLHPAFALLPARGCELILHLMDHVITIAASIPGGHAWLPPPSGVWVGMFYLVMVITLMMPTGLNPRGWRYGWIAFWFVVTLGWAWHQPALQDGSLEATFVDVGHGTCVILRSGDQVWLYDCGRLGNETGNSRGIDETLWSLKVTRLNGIILSHADADHFNALPGILRRFAVDQVVTPPGMLDEPEAALIPIRRAIDRAGVPVCECSAGDQLSLGDETMQVLHPPAERIEGSDNANSLVIRIDHRGTSFLLPGDLEPPGTDDLMDQPRPIPGGVLMAPHHGSLRMDAEKVLHWMRPRQTVVSGGRLARRPEVSDMLAARGSHVWVTSRDGAIRVRISDDGKIETRCWLDSRW